MFQLVGTQVRLLCHETSEELARKGKIGGRIRKKETGTFMVGNIYWWWMVIAHCNSVLSKFVLYLMLIQLKFIFKKRRKERGQDLENYMNISSSHLSRAMQMGWCRFLGDGKDKACGEKACSPRYKFAPHYSTVQGPPVHWLHGLTSDYWVMGSVLYGVWTEPILPRSSILGTPEEFSFHVQ